MSFTQVLSASKWVTNLITVCTDLCYLIKELVLAASLQWTCTASNDHRQHQQQHVGGDCFDLLNGVEAHAEKQYIHVIMQPYRSICETPLKLSFSMAHVFVSVSTGLKAKLKFYETSSYVAYST